MLSSVTLRRLPELAGAAALVPDQQAGVRRRGRRAPAVRRRPAAAAAVDGRARTSCVRDPGRMLDAEEFLSPYGLRTLSRAHLDEPFTVHAGRQRLHRRLRAGRVDQRPVRRQLQLARPDLDAGQLPAHRGAARATPSSSATTCWSSTRPARARRLTLAEIADDLSRPADLAVPAGRGRPPARSTATRELFQTHPDWKDLIAFPEYFHGDNGAGLGAWHQTGWTALVVDLILTLRR